MRALTSSAIGPGHPDSGILRTLEIALLKAGGGIEKVRAEVPQLIRRAIDEVIDAPRTGRLMLGETEKTEKTYLGTKIEILIRKFFGFPKGLLDLHIDGHDVDIKNTVGGNWMIPTEAIGKACILIASDEKKAVCQLGLIVCRLEYLSASKNKDSKRSISKVGFENILWILRNQPYPANFWERLDPAAAKRILGCKAGTERIVQLFREVQKRPIHRDVIHAVAQQKDYMKRLRKNGGARDPLAREKIAILSGTYHNALLEKLGLPKIAPDEVLAIKADTGAVEALLRDADLL
jgi:hypothetical protein